MRNAFTVPTSLCPVCGTTLDRAAGVTASKRSEPTPGAFTICIGCASILIFGADMRLTLPAEGAFDAAAAQSPNLAKMKIVQRILAEERRKHPYRQK